MNDLEIKLHGDSIIETMSSIKNKIITTYPNSNLNKVSKNLLHLSEDIVEKSDRPDHKNTILKITSLFLAVCILSILIYFLKGLILKFPKDFITFVSLLEASLASSVFIGATIFYLNNIETKYKRKKALDIIDKLRSLSHIIDMHQLNKDPSDFLIVNSYKKVSHNYSTKESLSKYYDFCSELLSMINKLAAYYIQNLDDHEVREAVDQIEILTTNLSQKIWQKNMILLSQKPYNIISGHFNNAAS